MSLKLSRVMQRRLARALAAAAALVVVAGSAVLIAGYVRGLREAPRDKLRLADLEKASKTEFARLGDLNAERDRQLQASLARDRREQRVARAVALAAALLVIGAKWSIALGPRGLPSRALVLAERGFASPAAGLSGAAPQPAAGAGPAGDATETAVDLAPVSSIVEACGRGRTSAIPILQAVQQRYRYLPGPVLERVCELTDITPAQIAGVASFYTQFRRTPVGEHLVKVCHGTACHVAGAERISAELRRFLNIPEGYDTDAAMKYTLEPVACMGCCTLAPVAQVDGATHGHLTPETLLEVLRRPAGRPEQELHARLGAEGAGPAGTGLPVIRIGLGSCCVAGGSGEVFEAMRGELARAGVEAVVKRVGCVGMCHNTPLVEAILPGKAPALYARVQADDVPRIVRRHFGARGFRRLAERWPGWLDGRGRNGRTHGAVPGAAGGVEHRTGRAIELRDPPIAAFLGPQQHIATEHSGRIDPVCLDEYLGHDGFEALARVVHAGRPEAVIDEIRASGLRGRGGAGFPTGEKWARARVARGDRRYVICNGDEGDPGAFMDRMLMESFPYRIIEGLAIAAFAVGAEEGYFYIRAEYPLAVQRIREAIRHCEARGYLGERILGTGFSLRLQIMEGAGAFVCGEETALIASLHGERGMPRLRPPFPAESGLHGVPTLVNNVETLACVPWIIRHGAPAFADLGTATSKGTKVFALAGKIRRGGLIEVPMGVTIRQIVEDIGGGIQDDPVTGFPRRFKAVQVGGPSGGCVPASLADTPVDFEALASVGAIMGSGGLVVLDDTDCMVDIARYFLSFTQDQSCGKCTYCRIGTRRMLDILERLCAGRAEPADLRTLEALARDVAAGSLCGLGRTAPNPVLTTLRHFREEFEAHLRGRCPAGRCKSLIRYRVTERCIGCTLCAQHCPADAIAYRPYETHEIDAARCTRCDICRTRCPEHAILVES
jgi:NADH-quinone oxidoreductase subunit F